MSALQYCHLGSSTGLCGVERPAEPASSAAPMSLARLLPKAMNLDSAKVPQQRLQTFQKQAQSQTARVFPKLQCGIIPKPNNNKSRPLVRLWLSSIKHRDHLLKEKKGLSPVADRSQANIIPPPHLLGPRNNKNNECKNH